MVSLVASARVHGFEKVAVTFFFAPHALAREPIKQKTWKLECPSALPCSIFPQNLTKIVQSVQLLCNSLEIEAIKRPMRTSIHFIHYPVLIKSLWWVVTYPCPIQEKKFRKTLLENRHPHFLDSSFSSSLTWVLIGWFGCLFSYESSKNHTHTQMPYALDPLSRTPYLRCAALLCSSWRECQLKYLCTPVPSNQNHSRT